MFVHKNLVHQQYALRRNNILKGLALFFLWASAVLLFSSADLILNPYISNSFVYLQKMFLSPNGTSNMQATISFDGGSGSIVANSFSWTTVSTVSMNASALTAAVATLTSMKASQICDTAWANCFAPVSVAPLSGDVSSLSGRLAQLEALVQSLSGRVSSYHP